MERESLLVISLFTSIVVCRRVLFPNNRVMINPIHTRGNAERPSENARLLHVKATNMSIETKQDYRSNAYYWHYELAMETSALNGSIIVIPRVPGLTTKLYFRHLDLMCPYDRVWIRRGNQTHIFKSYSSWDDCKAPKRPVFLAEETKWDRLYLTFYINRFWEFDPYNNTYVAGTNQTGFEIVIYYLDLPKNCSENYCLNKGLCLLSRDGIAYCVCLPGYRGIICEENIQTCGRCVDECLDQGFQPEFNKCYGCAANEDSRFCTKGVTLPDVGHACLPFPCKNGASCRLKGEDDYFCACLPGYEGHVCEVEINECAPSPCKNNGTCADGVNDYICTCKPGYQGKSCEIYVNECESHPCKNDGTCVDGIDAFFCECMPMFTGTRCELDLRTCPHKDMFATNELCPTQRCRETYECPQQQKCCEFAKCGSTCFAPLMMSTTDLSKSLISMGVICVAAALITTSICCLTCRYFRRRRKQKRLAEATETQAEKTGTCCCLLCRCLKRRWKQKQIGLTEGTEADSVELSMSTKPTTEAFAVESMELEASRTPTTEPSEAESTELESIS